MKYDIVLGFYIQTYIVKTKHISIIFNGVGGDQLFYPKDINCSAITDLPFKTHLN